MPPCTPQYPACTSPRTRPLTSPSSAEPARITISGERRGLGHFRHGHAAAKMIDGLSPETKSTETWVFPDPSWFSFRCGGAAIHLQFHTRSAEYVQTIELAKHLEKLHINNMYKSDFYWTWDKTDEELEAIFTVADVLRDLRERNKSTGS